MSRRGSVGHIIQNQVQNVSIALNALKYLTLTTRYAEKNVFKLQSLLEKVFVHQYGKTKVQEEQSIANKKVKLFE